MPAVVDLTQVILMATWKRQASLPLMPTTLASLLLCAILLATDATKPISSTYDQDHIVG